MTELNAITDSKTEANTFYANPYDTSATGFYFNTFESFIEQVQAHRCEEFETDYINGEDEELFGACGVNEANLELWFDVVEELADWERVSLFYCCELLGYSLEDALEEIENRSITEGTAKDYAEQLVEDCGMLDGMPGYLQMYFDYDAFARDMVLNGDVTEFTYNGTTYTATT